MGCRPPQPPRAFRPAGRHARALEIRFRDPVLRVDDTGLCGVPEQPERLGDFAAFIQAHGAA
jgi:hypothetical protein